MNDRRSYLDTMNAGRRRRSSTSLEDLTLSLDELESRIREADFGQKGDRAFQDRTFQERTRRLSSEASYRDMPRHDVGQRLAADDRDYRAEPGIAGELGALRRELRHQMGAGLRREFDALKKDIETAMRTSGPASQIAELGAEFERLSSQINTLAQQSDDRQINMLRLEMEQVKGALGKLAREETIQSFDRKWDDFDQRWTDIANQVSSVHRRPADDGAMQALTARLEQIGEAVNALPTSVALRSLEERMKILAASVDQFAHQQDRLGPDALEAIEERLNEISRAVAASSTAAQPATYDPQPFERIEARISSLARQLGEVVEENPARGLADHIALLSHRIEEIARRVDMPEHAIERLAGQIDQIARRMDDYAGAPELVRAFDGLDGRLASLSNLLEQRHEDALVQGQNLFRDLEYRLEAVTARLDRDDVPLSPSANLLEAMDTRFAELASRIEEKSAAPANGAMRDLEARLEAISRRIETSTTGGVDPRLIQSLESQIADLTTHIAKPATSMPAAQDLSPRLEKIEESIVAGRHDVIEAARLAAEEAVRSHKGSTADGALVSGLVDDLKSLEALTRRSDDRNAKTFEAIHDTLLKIVDRLGAVEAQKAAFDEPPSDRAARGTLLDRAQTPSIDPTDEAMPMVAADEPVSAEKSTTPQKALRSPATAAAEAAADAVLNDARDEAAEQGSGRRTMFGGLTRALKGRKAKTADQVPPVLAGDAPAEPVETIVPTVDLDAPLDPALANQPLEPGSGAPDLNAIMKRVRDERAPLAKDRVSDTGKSDFIAAARRAAQAAAAEAEMMKSSPAAKTKSGSFSLGGLLKNRRKPVLMGVAAILMALAALQIGRSFTAGSDVAEPPAVAQLPTVEDASPIVTGEAPAPEQQVRMADEPAVQPSAQSFMAQVPDTAEDVSDDWLEAELLPTDTVAADETVSAAPPLEEERPTAQEEAALPEIPLEAGPAALREAAAEGDPKAIYEIGNRYAEGRGVEQDMAKAAGWYEQAADQGLAPAQYRIGNLLEKGIGVERDVAQAKTWYQLAAAQGNASAMHNLAVLFAMGADGVTDNDSAARWFVEAAELGVRDSQFNLGILSAKGVGVEQDLEEAYKWFALVAKSGDADAAAKRDEVAASLSPERLEKAQAAAELWRAKDVNAEANSVEIPDGWSEGEETTSGVDMKQAVRNIQRILNKNGYDAGGEDGVMGQKTKSAIASFQKDSGMAPTGEVDEKVVRALLAKR